DIDTAAIADLIRRKFAYFAAKKSGENKWYSDQSDAAGPLRGRSMTVHTMVADLRAPPEALAAQIDKYGAPAGGVDGIVCNFAFHYMCDTIEHMRGLLTLNAGLLKKGGLFMLTVLDGAAVFDLLKDYKHGETWSLEEGGVVKYAITKKYTASAITAAGQN